MPRLAIGPEAAIAASSPGSGDDGSNGVAPPKNEMAIERTSMPRRRAHEGMGEVVGHGAREEAEGDDAAQDPRDQLLDLRVDLRQLPDGDHRDEGEDDHPAELDADLDAEDARDRDAHQVPARSRGEDGLLAPRREPCRAPAGQPRGENRRSERDDPDGDRDLRPERLAGRAGRAGPGAGSKV